MMKRSDDGSWGLPGGGLEFGETLETAARREVCEETGLELGEMSTFGVFSGPEMFHRYPNGDEVYGVMIVYRTRDWHGAITLNNEHTQWDWFPVDEFPNDLNPLIIPVIDTFKRCDLLP